MSGLRGKLAAATEIHGATLVRAPAFGLSRAIPAAALISVLLGGGTVFASQDSLPGEALYPIKRLAEDIRLAATVNPRSKAEKRLNMAETRLEEINALISRKKDENQERLFEFQKNIEKAASDFDRRIKEAADEAEMLENGGELEDALLLNVRLNDSGSSYKKLIEKNREGSSEPIHSRLEDLLEKTEEETERAEKQSERLLKLKEKKMKGGMNDLDEKTELDSGASGKPEKDD